MESYISLFCLLPSDYTDEFLDTCESIVNLPDTNTDNYGKYDFAMQMAVLRHIMLYSQGVEWGLLKDAILQSIAKLVGCRWR